jgi:glycosyltransferase involved in cell wall biosynthesis
LHQPSVTKKSQILFVGRLFPRKGAQFLLSALAEIDLQGWECVVAGDGPMMQELRNQAQDLGLPVKFPGFVKGAALEELYSTSAIFVMPSLAENFPVVLLEALSAGCSVITTNTTGMPEVVGDAGLLTPPGDVLALRAAIQRLMNDEDLRHRLGDAAHRQVAMFNWNGVLSQHEAVYMQIVKTDR